MENGLHRIGNHSVVIKVSTFAGQNLYKQHGFEFIGGTPGAGSVTFERKPAERDLQAWRLKKGIEKSP